MGAKSLTKRDVTSQVEFNSDAVKDVALLPITKCTCGAEYELWGDFTLGTDPNDPVKCPECGRAFYFEVNLTVYEVEEIKL